MDPLRRPAELEPGERLADVTCPQCRRAFRLCWDDIAEWREHAPEGERYVVHQRTTLVIRSCPSGGVYDVRIDCPHCDYEEEL
jgi:hypothetical protein